MDKIRLKKILIVDDDEDVRSLCEEVLTVAGYNVNTAIHGLHALDMLRQADYDLVISDVNMPELGGIDLYVSALKRYPQLKRRFLFICGDFNPEILGAISELDLRCINKPFKISEFLGVVDSVMLKTSSGSLKEAGKRQEGRFNLSARCEIFEEGEGRRFVNGHTENVSCVGIKVVYPGDPISPRTKLSVYLSLNELNLHRGAVVIWSEPVNARDSASGLKFDEPVPVALIVNTVPSAAN